MTSTTQNSETSQDQSQTALILEQVEMLLALHEETQASNQSKLGNLIDKLESSLETQNVERFEEIDQRIAAISQTIESQATLLESGAIAGSDSGSMTSDQNHGFEKSIERLTEQFHDRTENIVKTFEARITDMFDSLGERVVRISDGISSQENGISSQENNVQPTQETDEGDSTTHWHRQKEAMLSKYGIDPDYRPLMELTAEDQPLVEEEVEIPEPLVALHDSIDNLSEADAEKIEQLKQELTQKLRDAEVELSINRAKLSQQQAELEASHVELERRASAIEEKYEAVRKAPNKKSGFLDRLTRHLRKNDKKKLPINDESDQ